MNKIEAGLFKYCCKQADYDKTAVYNSENSDFWQLNLYTQKHISVLCGEYSAISNIDKDNLIKLANNWLKKGVLVKDNYAKENKHKYFFIFNGRSKYSRKLYNLCPYRTINIINRLNPYGYKLRMPSHSYYKRKLKKKEKEIFRFIIRKYDLRFSYLIKKSENFASDYIKIKIPNINFVIEELQNKYSKRFINKLLYKWNRKSIINIKYTDYIVILLDLHNKIDEAYINSIPHNILLNIINKNSE